MQQLRRARGGARDDDFSYYSQDGFEALDESVCGSVAVSEDSSAEDGGVESVASVASGEVRACRAPGVGRRSAEIRNARGGAARARTLTHPALRTLHRACARRLRQAPAALLATVPHGCCPKGEGGRGRTGAQVSRRPEVHFSVACDVL